VLRGDVVCLAKDVPKLVGKFVAKIKITWKYEIHVGFTPHVFCHTCCFPGRITDILEKWTRGERIDKPKRVVYNEMAMVEIEPPWGIFVETFKDMPPLVDF